ncbi:MAG: AraC family transcriptional regulator [Pseudomonadales bacterium]|nr:AraC family transcriptional regulator [Pseudomonadales bacterium]MDG1444172.1 AraC family transcriptional regulator [Pseudomonadales bacterium]
MTKPPRPLSLYDFRMESVRYELITLAAGEKIIRKAFVAGYFYHVTSGLVTAISEYQDNVLVGPRDTITLGGFMAHEIVNNSDASAELLIGAEPYEVLSWLKPAPIVYLFKADSINPFQKRLLLAMDLVIEEISNPETPPDQPTLERTAELIIFYFFRMVNPVDGRLYPFPSDPRIMASVEAINANPARQWTVGQLAEVAHMSRSAFSDRFHALVGDTPIRTLATIRLKVAARKMLEGQSIESAASQSGYGSEEAFNRAFKRQFNIPPGRWIRSLN